jgi:hypothetical protein
VTAATQQPQQAAAAQPTTVQQAAAAAAGPPSFCKPADAGPAYPNAAGPTNMVWGGNMLKVYHNLYFHNK